jgi:hypothetical protein
MAGTTSDGVEVEEAVLSDATGDPDVFCEELTITITGENAREAWADARRLAAVRRAIKRGGRDALARLAKVAEEFEAGSSRA